MKALSILILLLTETGFEAAFSAYSLQAIADSDSVPAPRTASLWRPKFRPGPAFVADAPTLASLNRYHTTYVRTAKKPLGHEPAAGEWTLPHLGVDARTLTVRLGEELLKAGTDYTYQPSTNRIRMLNQRVLQSDKPIEMTYDMARFRLASP